MTPRRDENKPKLASQPDGGPELKKVSRFRDNLKLGMDECANWSQLQHPNVGLDDIRLG